MKRRGFLGALLAAPLALVGLARRNRKLRRYMVEGAWGNPGGALKRGDILTISGIYTDNWPAGPGTLTDDSGTDGYRLIEIS